MRSSGFKQKYLGQLAAAMTLVTATAGGALAAPQETVLYSFQSGTSDGQVPAAGVTLDGMGNVYGTAESGGALGGGVVFKVTPDGTETVLHSFMGGANDGFGPQGALLIDKKGNLYGTTTLGGASGHGALFKLAPDGKLRLLHSFAGSGDGNQPEGDLLADKAGNIYGAAAIGGADFTCHTKGNGLNSGCGTVYKLAPDGTFTTLHAFEHPDKQGLIPTGFLVADPQGNLYGTTETGGGDKPCPAGPISYGCAVVFEVSPSGAFSVLHAFTGGSDGAFPYVGLLRDSQGNLYGATTGGGNLALCDTPVGQQKGCGVIFKLSPSGALSVLHTFTAGDDGAGPAGSLIADCKGNLYGTTSYGGAAGNGTVFQIAPDGTFTTLYAFQGSPDGSSPFFSGVVADGEGNLYGTTEGGGATGNGAVFKLTNTGFVTGAACGS